MLLQRLFAALAFTLILVFGMPSPALAKTAGAPATKEPTIQQIYEAANGGRMAEADAMIAKVLKNHPNSAKAHYVHAELLAMNGKLDDARDELSQAKELSPGLKFAKADSVAKLERKLEKPAEIKAEPPPPVPSPVTAPALSPEKADTASSSGPIPWTPIGIVALFIVAYLVFQRRRRATTFDVPAAAGAPRFSRPTSDSSMGYGSADQDREYPASAPAAASQGPGIGGALAAGAVAGVGAVVAGEVLRHLLNDRSDDNRGSTINIFNNHRDSHGNASMGRSLWPSSDPEPEQQPDRSFVDNDFGIKDTSSWDDSSSSSSSDSSSSDSSSSSDW
ncbi:MULTISPECIES: tetratricopeptide repeat protein [unclassified Variovorax]|uniref:tetratricopeptide repeat protein n=1 Tax=unclassified Variovorax TaxID=663243 RepID=UPI003F44DD5D